MKTNGEGAQMQMKKEPTLKQLVAKNIDQIKSALPENIKPERMMRIALTALTKDSKLQQCTPASFMGALLTSAQLGLECNTPLGQAYLIPYNERGAMTAHFQLGYQGLLELCYRTKQYKTIQARVVYEGDEFEYAYGFEERLYHKPYGKSKTPTHVYALYELFGGGRAFEVMTWDEVMAHAGKYSQAQGGGSSSPWKTDPEGMAKKTLLKKVLKFAPKAVEVAQAISSDEAVISVRKESAGGQEWIARDIEFSVADDTPANSPVESRRQASGADLAKQAASVDDAPDRDNGAPEGEMPPDQLGIF